MVGPLRHARCARKDSLTWVKGSRGSSEKRMFGSNTVVNEADPFGPCNGTRVEWGGIPQKRKRKRSKGVPWRSQTGRRSTPLCCRGKRIVGLLPFRSAIHGITLLARFP